MTARWNDLSRNISQQCITETVTMSMMRIWFCTCYNNTARCRLIESTYFFDETQRAEPLQCLNIPSLELRRLQLDSVFCYKVIFGLICVSLGEFFTFSSVSQTRGHPYKLYKPRYTNTVRHNSFIGRVVNVWNALPTTVNFSSLSTFESSLRNADFSS